MSARRKSWLYAAVAAAHVITTASVTAEPVVVLVPRPVTGPYADIGRSMTAVIDATTWGDVIPGRRIELRPVECPPEGRWPAEMRADAVIGQPCRGETPEGMAALRIHVSLGEPFTARRPRGLKIAVASKPATTTLIDDVVEATPADAAIAIVHDRSQQGRTTADVVAEGLSKAGRRTVRRFAIAGAQRTFTAVVEELRAGNFGHVVLVTFPVEAAAFAIELRSTLPTVRIIAPDLLASAEFGRLAGPAAEGVRVVARTTVATMTRESPTAAALVSRIEQSGSSATPAALHLAAALDAYMATVQDLGTADPPRVRAGLTEHRPTRLGPIRFEEAGHVLLPIWTMYEWRAGNLVPVP